jgi:hypothetical protein
VRPLVLALAGALAAGAPEPGLVPRYDLAAGDHLVFRTTLVRDGRGIGSSISWTTRSEWESHLVVLARDGPLARVGIQRSRVSLQVVSAGGTDRERLLATASARPAVLTEANWIRPDGRPELPTSALREEGSELLALVTELQPLPAGPLAASGPVPIPPPLGGQFQVAGHESHGGEDCLRLDGKQGDLRLRLDYCPASGLPALLELTGRSIASPSLEVRETVTVERTARRRGESPEAWLGDPRARLAVLDAILVSPALPVSAAALWPLLEDGDPEVQRRVLGVAYRHRQEPPRERLEALARAGSATVRRLAGRFLSPVAASPRPSEALLAVARAVRDAGPLPEWTCAAEPDRPAAMAGAQRARGQVPGATLRFLRAPGFEGWPYVLDVPEDYRGDEPRPLLVVLGGGAGQAIRTATISHATVEPQGWLVVYPHAAGLWWEGQAPDMFPALLGELLQDLNVDTDRVYLSGFSNGGAGTLLFAALWPDRFAAAAPLMGVGLRPLGSRFPSVAGLTHLPWLFVHGSEDMPLASAEIVKALHHADPAARAELRVLPGRGHDIRLGTDEGLTLPFLERQVRAPFPRQVRLRALTPTRAFWVDVVEKDGGLAEADAAIEGPDIRIRTRRVRRLRVLLRRELVGPAETIRINVDGREVYAGPLTEDCRLLAGSWRATGDPHLAHSWERTFDLPR